MNRYTWFPHIIGAKDRPFLAAAIRKFGHFGYACWFMLIEEILNSGNADEITIDTKELCKKLHSKAPRVRQFLEFCQASAGQLPGSCPAESRMLYRWSPASVWIKIPKIRKTLGKLRFKIPSMFPQNPLKSPSKVHIGEGVGVGEESVPTTDEVNVQKKEDVPGNGITPSVDTLYSDPGIRKGEPISFTAFWTKWCEIAPISKQDGRADSLDQWSYLQPNNEVQAAILADLKRRAKTEEWRKDGGQYMPLPKNYLRGRLWEDAPKCVLCHERPIRDPGSKYCELCAKCKKCGNTDGPFISEPRDDRTPALICERCLKARRKAQPTVRIDKKPAGLQAAGQWLDKEESFG